MENQTTAGEAGTEQIRNQPSTVVSQIEKGQANPAQNTTRGSNRRREYVITASRIPDDIVQRVSKIHAMAIIQSGKWRLAGFRKRENRGGDERAEHTCVLAKTPEIPD